MKKSGKKVVKKWKKNGKKVENRQENTAGTLFFKFYLHKWPHSFTLTTVPQKSHSPESESILWHLGHIGR